MRCSHVTYNWFGGFDVAGLPITMSLVYMEIAKRVGLQMQGVSTAIAFPI